MDNELDKEKYKSYERETIFNANDETREWSCYTWQKSIISKLLKAGYTPDRIGAEGEYYFSGLPFKALSVRAIREKSTRTMSDAHKQKLKEAREAKKG
jgi:hypothetical protein